LPSAEDKEGSSPSTAPPFEKGGRKLFGKLAKTVCLVYRLRERNRTAVPLSFFYFIYTIRSPGAKIW